LIGLGAAIAVEFVITEEASGYRVLGEDWGATPEKRWLYAGIL